MSQVSSATPKLCTPTVEQPKDAAGVGPLNATPATEQPTIEVPDCFDVGSSGVAKGGPVQEPEPERIGHYFLPRIGVDLSGITQGERAMLQQVFLAAEDLWNWRLEIEKGESGLVFPPYASDEEAAKIHDEIAAYKKTHPGEASALDDPYNVIERTADGGFRTIPMAEKFQELFESVAQRLDSAAACAPDETLKAYLAAQADAYRTNEFEAANELFTRLDSDWELYLGMSTVIDIASGRAIPTPQLGKQDRSLTPALNLSTPYQNEVDALLPLKPGVPRWEHVDESSPMVAVDLMEWLDVPPYDGMEWPSSDLGSTNSRKQVLPNMARAITKHITMPVIEEALAPELVAMANEQNYIEWVGFHEFGHLVGPVESVLPDGRVVLTDSHEALGADVGVKVEEAKADPAGLIAIDLLAKKGVISTEKRNQLYVGYLMDCFKFARIVDEEAFPIGFGARANLNFLTAHGALIYDEVTQRWSMDFDKVGEVARLAAEEWVTLLRTGDKAAAEAYLAQWQHTPAMDAFVERANALDLPQEPLGEFYNRAEFGLPPVEWPVDPEG
jgi:hypothetical protein